MKTLSIKTAPIPQLSGTQIERLGQTINGFVEQIETSRTDRIKKILRFREEYRDDFHQRKEKGSIFALSNISVPVLKGTCTSMSAKFEDEIWNGEKPFIVKPQGVEDIEAAKKQEKYWNWKLINQTGLADVGSAVCDVLVSEGTCITKRCWKDRRSYFNRIEKHLVGPDGNELMFNGKPVMSDHPTRVETTTEMTPNGPISSTRHILEGLEIEHTPDFEIVEVPVKDSIVHENRAESVIVPFEDFLCLETVANIEDSPLLGHAYELKVWQLVERVRQSAEDGWLPDQVLESIRAAQEATNEGSIPTGAARDKQAAVTGALVPIKHLGESIAKLSQTIHNYDQYKTVKLVETYIRYDLDEDGYVEDLVVLWDRKTEKPIWVDSIVNVYADCENPFTIYGLYRVQNRWYSLGVLEFMELAQKFVDYVFNRMNFRTAMSANPAMWFKRGNFVKMAKEWGPGATYELNTQAAAADSLGFFVMPQIEQTEWQFFQFFIQLIQLVTGITTAAQGDVSTLPSTATATGISSIIEEGNKLFRKMIARIKRSVRKDILGLVKLIQQNMDEQEVFRYMDGAKEVTDVMTPEDIRELEYDVDVVVTRMSAQMHQKAMETALQVVGAFIALSPEYQKRLRSLFVSMLSASGITEADAIIPSEEQLAEGQNKDAVLQQAIVKLQQDAVAITGGQLDPTKEIAKDLIGISEVLKQLQTQQQAPENAPAGAPAMAA